MKNFFIIFLTFLIATSFTADYGDPNLVYWETPTDLTWSHFKGRPSHGSSHHAYSMLGLSYEVKSNTTTEVTFIISAYFDKQSSWVKKGQTTDRLLKHEQKHFDICEIHRRMFVKALSEIEFFTYSNVNPKIKKIFNDINRSVDKMQMDYDKETQHSKIQEQQIKWDAKIQALLKEYDGHKKTEITVELRK